MDKVKMTTPDGVTENIEKLAALFPAAVTEMRGEDGTLRKGIDFEKLRQLLSRDIVEGGERYEFSWVGKKAAMAEAARPTTETLRPVKADSRDWDTTENLYIEGDNLAALKILQESYLGKVKMIYIDPPYNTGNDFIYADDFMRTQDEENEQMGMFDEEQNRMFKNTDNRGHYHSDWCSMIFSRLLLARNLLSDDGIIFISIDDNEISNLSKLCNEIFGESNYIATYLKQSKVGGGSDSKFVVKEHEYCLVYGKDVNKTAEMFVEHDPEYLKRYKEKDNNGRYFWDTFARPGLKNPIHYDIIAPDGTVMNYGWIHGKERYEQERKAGLVRIVPKSGGGWSVQFKQYLNAQGKKPRSMTMDFGGSIEGKNDISSLFNNDKLFSYPKSVKFIKTLLATTLSNDGVVLDFFSGSATTAHAVMQLNAEDGGHRKFIMVQLPEPCDEKSEAYKAGYKNICEIGKERIRRAGDAILKENDCWKSVPLNRNDGSKVGDYTPAKIVNIVNTNKGPVEMVDISKDLSKLDIGFRVFRVDSSNMRDVYYKPEEFTQTMLGEAVSNIKPGRTDLDLLYACLLDCGVPIHLPHTTTTVDGCTIHNVDNGALMACFDEHIPHSVIRAMAAETPLQVIFRDSAFAADADKINVTEIFKNLSPDTKVRVI